MSGAKITTEAERAAGRTVDKIDARLMPIARELCALRRQVAEIRLLIAPLVGAVTMADQLRREREAQPPE